MLLLVFSYCFAPYSFKQVLFLFIAWTTTASLADSNTAFSQKIEFHSFIDGLKHGSFQNVGKFILLSCCDACGEKKMWRHLCSESVQQGHAV